ncbi:hypothetical protein BDK51DRAFT_43940 [Blyttiomyces helicus]|uniref:Uncharacterized protein n=1 Tax=Blyttiomyces helicus TaxID=388810 RepID=A0A4P9W875_9FUNG|nr:hypothetical protein BDK51DRAFT_43940 [Blyttiomyces helicus]|eukprot:RKO88719.1 hypothetical protein BDK51DRAFT_43940 [Blyttiomyces helicus]
MSTNSFSTTKRPVPSAAENASCGVGQHGRGVRSSPLAGFMVDPIPRSGVRSQRDGHVRPCDLKPKLRDGRDPEPRPPVPAPQRVQPPSRRTTLRRAPFPGQAKPLPIGPPQPHNLSNDAQLEDGTIP